MIQGVERKLNVIPYGKPMPISDMIFDKITGAFYTSNVKHPRYIHIIPSVLVKPIHKRRQLKFPGLGHW